ncbi:MAG TPA: cytochrome c-type biogenesis protein CcmH [Thermoanaerobaculia bacterium]|nr:cytochrome c-type biogenesis protein CcmH [Thermoanaerobaculia bacterium]
MRSTTCKRLTGAPKPGSGSTRRKASRALALAILLLAVPLAAFGADSEEEATGTDFGVVQDLGPPADAPKTGQELEEATRDLSSRLRCPVCQGLSVADSTAVSALAMRDEIRELFAQGYSEEQIVSYFESSFGEFVLLVPKARGFNLLVWLLPVLGLLVGLFIVLRQTRGPAALAQRALPDEGGELAEYRARVLREVEGGGGPVE